MDIVCVNVVSLDCHAKAKAGNDTIGQTNQNLENGERQRVATGCKKVCSANQ